MKRNKKPFRLLLLCLMVISIALAGCEGDDGDRGPAGPPGPPGPNVINATGSTPEALAALQPVGTITSVTIASAPVVEFTVVDSTSGLGITGLQTINAANPGFVRMDIAKLVPPAPNSGDPNVWVNYIRSSTTTAPTTESNGTLVDHGDGRYTYTFNTDIAAVSGIPFEPALTHRVAGQIGAGSIPLRPMNLAFDFVPAGGPVTTTRLITSETNCNQCHNPLVVHGRRFRIDYCVTCHNPDLAQGEGDMPFMTHRIHISGKFDVLDDGVDYAEVTYPQDVRNCRKCHSGLPDSDNWMDTPTLAACGGCHEAATFPGGPIDFETGAGHLGGAQTTNAGCAICHPPASIEAAHVTENPTPNNPQVPPGAVNFAYEISEVTVNEANQPVVQFRITADGAPLDLTTFPPAGFTSNIAFLVAYALPQGEIATPADYNNFGRPAAQPASVSLANLANGSQGTLACAEGNCTATLTAAPYPENATMRSVGLQGYFTQTAGTNGIAATTPRHTPSVVKAVTGDATRRVVVDSAKCANCHEWLELHGGSRVLNVEICTLCHQPNLSSSGRGADPALLTFLSTATAGDLLPAEFQNAAGTLTASQGAINAANATITAVGNDPLAFPEDSNNLKDMIHGLHASADRNFDYEFVRDRGTSGIFYFDWAEVTFPGRVGICTTCHIDGTWNLPLDSNVLNTTVRTTGAENGLDADQAAVDAARETVPNPTDWVNTPTASACYYCHDSNLAVAHMRQNGGVISVANPDAAEFTQREDVNTVEACAICHGPGKQADVRVVHGL